MAKVDAIVYNSNAGHGKEYAKIISEATGVKAYDLEDAKNSFNTDTKVLFIGWIMGSGIKGYKKAVKAFNVLGVCAVGMAPMGATDGEIKNKNNLPKSMQFFYLQGGFEWDKVSGADKTIMKMVKKKFNKDFGGKENISEGEKDMLELVNNGGSRVSSENATKVIEWINS